MAIWNNKNISIEMVLSGYLMHMCEKNLFGVYKDKETVHIGCYHQGWELERIGNFQLKLHSEATWHPSVY
jgi:hypothetical protein